MTHTSPLCRRKVYDQTGSVEASDDELGGEKFDDLYDHYRSVFAKVTEDDIEQFEEQYRGSDEERGDVLTFFKRFNGNMNQVGTGSGHPTLHLSTVINR